MIKNKPQISVSSFVVTFTRSGFIYLLIVLLQVGTAVVTGQNGRLAMGRLGSLCEQVKKIYAFTHGVCGFRLSVTK